MTTSATSSIGSGWVEILDGSEVSEALLQLRHYFAPAQIVISATEPTSDTNSYFTLSTRSFPGISVSLGIGEKAYVRSAEAQQTVIEIESVAR